MTKTPKPRLSKIDWMQAGFRALTLEGASALRAEKIARDIGATKGSFYWHFKDVQDFKSQMLAHWYEEAFEAVTASVLQEAGPKDQLLKLMALASQSDDAYGGHAAEPAIRAWAQSEEMAAEAVRAIDEKRIAFLAQLLRMSGREDAIRPRLLYAAYVGFLSIGESPEVSMEDALSFLAQNLFE